MADRDRDGWDRDRDYYGDRDREYRRDDDRGLVSRGADEVRSWFGDDEARRRRHRDDQRDRRYEQRERDYGPNSERSRREHGWQREAEPRDPAWQSGRSAAYGDQRDFVSRGADWNGSRNDSPRGREWDDPGRERNAQWQGGPRDYGDEDSPRYGGNYTARQTNPSMSGGYGAGNYDSGNLHTGSAGPYGAYRGFGSQPSFGPRTSGWDNVGSSGTSRYGSDALGTSSESGFAGRGPRNYQRSDDRIREDVNERLTDDARIDASDIDVQVRNGEVTLSGTVDERRTRRLAEEIIENIPGVRDVRNDLRVTRSAWSGGEDRPHSDTGTHRRVGEESRAREDGAIGHSGDPQQRDDVTRIKTK
ncbi:MAG: BON domain-containing protein [Acidobacteria bacterium]|nr:BON domain-containing protein [Acidobacteriota bacterium]